MFTTSPITKLDRKTVIKAIKYNEDSLDRFNELERYYEGLHDILDRAKAGQLSNNKMVINHAREITDIKVGYFIGNPVEYQTTNKESEEKIPDITPFID